MTILVTTPTGKIGRRVLQELLAPEFSVRIITRDPARVPEEIRAQVEVIHGSSDDETTLRLALDGMEALFWCVPGESLGETDVRGHYERFARAAGQAIRWAETPRVVTVSAGGKGLTRNAGPISGLHAMEDILNESGAAIRHLRCGSFMENFLGQLVPICRRGVLSYPIPGHIPLPLVAATDVADVALRWLVRRDWTGIRGIGVHGPEDLSCSQAAAVLERVLERPVRFHEVSANLFIRGVIGAGASSEYAHGLVSMFGEMAQGICRAELRTADSTTPTTLAAWTRSELLPLAESLRIESDAAPVSADVCNAGVCTLD